MIKHIKKHHLHLGWLTALFSISIILTSILWWREIIELPASWLYYSRQLSGSVSEHPKLSVELPLKFHRQEHSLSCEAATLKMVLNFHGIDVSESEIIKKMPFDTTLRSGNIWGDPHLGFVGNIDGKMMVDGYGVYWEALAVTGSNWTKVKVLKNGLVSDLVENISQGRPVIVWGYLGRGKPVSWQTPEGKKIYGVNGEHTRVVYGYKGPADEPDGFMVMDPTYGPAYWAREKFMRNWDAFGRAGIVVFE